MTEAIEKILANQELWENFVNQQNSLNDDFASIDELLDDSLSLQIMRSYKVSQNTLREIITRLRSQQNRNIA